MKIKLLACLFSITTLFTFGQNKQIIPYKQGDLWGYCDTNAVISVLPKFQEANFFIRNQGKVIVNGKIGYIDYDGEFLITPKYDTVVPYYNSKTYKARLNNKYGVVKNNIEIIPFIYENISAIGTNVYRVSLDGKFGVIEDRNGISKRIIKTEYDEIEYLSWKKQYRCKTAGKIEIIDQNGKNITIKQNSDPEYYDVEAIDDYDENAERYPQFISFSENGKKGLLVKRKSRRYDEYGKILFDTIPALYDSIYTKEWYSHCYVVSQNGKWGAITLENEIYIPIEFEDIGLDILRFQSYATKPYRQIFKVKKNGKWGVIGNKMRFQKRPTHNDTLVPFIYDDITTGTRHFIVKSENGYGILHRKTLKEIVQPKYHKIKYTCESVGKFYVYIIEDKNGEIKYVGQNGVEYFE